MSPIDSQEENLCYGILTCSVFSQINFTWRILRRTVPFLLPMWALAAVCHRRGSECLSYRYIPDIDVQVLFIYSFYSNSIHCVSLPQGCKKIHLPISKACLPCALERQLTRIKENKIVPCGRLLPQFTRYVFFLLFYLSSWVKNSFCNTVNKRKKV